MPRSLSLTALQVNALTTSDDTILYNAQARDISLYGGTNLASLLTQLEINNVTGDCLTLRFNNDINNYANFKMKSSGTFDVTINNGDKSFNIVNHNGSTFGLKLGGTLVTSTAAELNKLSGFTGNFTNLDYLTGITPGTATAGKALVTDSNNNLVGINDLSTQNLTVAGTLVTASATELNYTDITTAGTAQAAKALVVDVNRDISNIRNLSATNLTGTLQTASQPNITSVGTLGSLTVTNQINVGTLDASSILVDGVDITTSISGSDPTNGITPGTVSASKVLLVDSNKNLTGMGNFTSTGTVTASTLTGTLSTASQPNVTTLAGVTSIGASSATTLTGTLQIASQSNVTSVGTLTGLTSNGNVNIAEHDGSTKGLQLAGNLVTANANEINKLSGLTSTTTELNTVAGVTPGTVSASKALVVDGNKDLSGIRNITTTGSISGAIGVSATTLTGTLSTASQPNITSVGTLANLTVSNQINVGTLDATAILVDGVDITTSISGSDPTNGITPGTVSASKVLLVDANKDLTGMRNLTSNGTITATTLTGTLSTASQPNITSVGTLTSLTANTNVDVAQHNGTSQGLKLAGTLVTASATDLNTTTGVTAGTVSASKHLVVDSNKDITGLRNLTSTGTITATTLTGTLSAGAQTGVSEVGTLSGLTSNGNVNIVQHNGSSTGLQLAGTLVTAVATDINKLSGVTEGTVSASKVVIADTNKDLTGIRNLTTTGTISGVTTLTATTLTGTLSTGAQTGITGVGTLTSLTSNGDVNIAEHDGSTKGFKLAGTLVTAVASDLNKISNVTASATDLNTTTGVTAGTVTASKHLVVDSNKDLTGMGNLTSTGTISATTLTGTLSTASQPNVTTLAGVTSIGASSSTTLTGTLQTASQPNVTTLAGVTSIGASSATTLTGTLQTASQPNVTSMSGLTSVGTLSSLALSGGISGATTINSSGIITNTNTTDSTSSTTGALVLSGGIGINDTSDASSSTNGGSLTTAGGAAIAKKLFVGSDLTVGGNLTISGVTTTINSTTTTITDNTVLLNSGPAGTGYDSGVLTQRYQIDNSAGTGDVVNDTAKESYAISSGTTSTITLPSGANANNNYYNNWWIKITSGTQNNQVRQITAYNGTTKVATLSTVLGGSPSSNDNVNLYNKAFTSLLWNESNKRFVSAFTSNDTSTPGALTIIDNADFQANNITGTLLTAAQPNITSVGTLTSLSTGSLTLNGTAITATATDINKLASVTSTATELNYVVITAIGTAEASKALVVNANRDITNIRNLTATDGQIITTRQGQGFSHNDGTINLVSFVNNSIIPGNAYFGTLTNHTLILQTNNASRMTISNTGATTLSSTLEVTGATTLSSNLTLNGASATLSLSGASAKLTIANTTASTSSTTGALQVAGGAYFGANSLFGGNVTMNGSLNVGTVGTSDNRINFNGLTLDAGTNMTVIAERIYETLTEKSELLLFKGNDPATASGPDRIRMRASEFRFQTYTTAEDYSGMSDNNNRLIISNAGDISISSTTASTSSSTGALQVAGGAYFGAASIFAGNVNINGTLTTAGLSISTLSLSGSTASTSSSTGALQVAGGAYFGAASLFGGNLTNNATIIAGNAAISAASWTTSGIQFRTSATTYTNTTAGAAASAVFNSFARPTLAASSALTTTNAATVYIDNSPLAGTNQTITNAYSLWVNSGNSLFGGTLRVTGQSTPAAGAGIEMGYTSDTANIYSYDRTNSSYKNINLNDKMYIKGADGTVGIGTNSPAYTLDLGSTAQNMKINLFGGIYGIGACNSNLQSFSDGGFTWHTVDGATPVTGNGAAPGTQIGRLHSSGHFEASSGIRAGTFSTVPYSGAGVEMHYASDIGDVFAYDRTNNGYKTLRLNGPSGINILSDGKVGINNSSPLHPLDVNGSANIRTNLTIGYSSNQLSANTYPLYITSWTASTGSANPAEKFSTSYGGSNWDGVAWGNCSARFNDILVATAFIGFSDERIKTNIEEIPIAFCKEFVMNCTPVSYFLKEDLRRGRNNTQFGYIAQDLEKKGFHYLVTHMNDDNEDLIEIIEDVNGKEYKSPAGVLLSVSYTEIIPLLAQNIKVLYLENENQQNEINELKQKNQDLETRLARLEAFISTLEITE